MVLVEGISHGFGGSQERHGFGLLHLSQRRYSQPVFEDSAV
jgi:hypothetical protein